MYDIVGDIANYAQFLPWCSRSTILESDQEVVTATLEFGARGIRETLTTRNVLVPRERIELQLVSGPFAKFEGVWQFTALGGEQSRNQSGVTSIAMDVTTSAAVGCKVVFNLEYQLAGHRAIFGREFVGRAADMLVDAFAQRCAALLV